MQLIIVWQYYTQWSEYSLNFLPWAVSEYFLNTARHNSEIHDTCLKMSEYFSEYSLSDLSERYLSNSFWIMSEKNCLNELMNEVWTVWIMSGLFQFQAIFSISVIFQKKKSESKVWFLTEPCSQTWFRNKYKADFFLNLVNRQNSAFAV